jgi:hypothetical protein
MSCRGQRGDEPGGAFCCPTKSFIRLDTNHQGITKRIFLITFQHLGQKESARGSQWRTCGLKVCRVLFVFGCFSRGPYKDGFEVLTAVTGMRHSVVGHMFTNVSGGNALPSSSG